MLDCRASFGRSWVTKTKCKGKNDRFFHRSAGRYPCDYAIIIRFLTLLSRNLNECRVSRNNSKLAPLDKYMAKHHILIMDDTLHETLGWVMKIDEHRIFGNNPDIDCALASTPEAARIILDDWKKQGITPDVIVADYLYGEHNGIHVLVDLISGLEKKPYKMFVTSKSGLNSYNSKQDTEARELANRLGIEYCHSSEILSIAAHCNGKLNLTKSTVSTNGLRKCVNERFGLDIPDQLGETILNKMEAERLEQERLASGPLSLQDIHDKLFQSSEEDQIKQSPAELLMRLDIDALRKDYQPRVDGVLSTINELGDPEYDIRFKEFSGGVVSGYAAYNAEQVWALKKQGKKAVLILQDFKPNQFALLKGIDGLVLLGNGPSHLAPLCKSLGIPAVFRLKEPKIANAPYAKMVNDELHLVIPEGSIVSVYNEETERYDSGPHKESRRIVHFGDPFSIGIETTHEPSKLDRKRFEERRYGKITPQAVEITYRDPSKDYFYKDMRTWADGVRLSGWHKPDKRSCNGMHVKTIVETPEALAEAVKHDTGGVGLLRTENIFLEESRQRALYTAILSDDEKKRKAALAEMQAAQERDFSELFATLNMEQEKQQKILQRDRIKLALDQLNEKAGLSDLYCAIRDSLTTEQRDVFTDLRYDINSKLDDWKKKQYPDSLSAITMHMFYDHEEEFKGFLREALPAMNEEQHREYGMLASAMELAPRTPFPITARLLDAKLTELLPDPASNDPEDRKHMTALATKIGMDETKMREKITVLRTEDARGVQFGTAMSSLYSVQMEAMLKAASSAQYQDLEVMVPFVKSGKDVARVREMMKPIAEKYAMQDHMKLGAMIETKESVFNAGEIARASDFLSFGTNDLSCELLGLPRNDIIAEEAWRTQPGKMEITEGKYPSRSLVPEVRSAMQMVVTAARSAKPLIKIGICGDQVAEDEASLQFCQSLYLDSVSVPTHTHVLVPTIFAAAKAAAKQRVMDYPRPKVSFQEREKAKDGQTSPVRNGGIV